VRLVIARCEIRYTGRLTATLPEALRLLVFKADGSVMVHSDAGGYKPQNWMTAPALVEEHGDPLERIVVRKAKADDRLDIAIAAVLSDVTHDMGEAGALEKEGVELELQEALAAAPAALADGLRLVRREWPTDVGPVDLVCRDREDGWVAVEVKRIATVEAVEQLTRYLERLAAEPGAPAWRGLLAAQAVKPQARALAKARGIDCVEVDLDVVRGLAEPSLTLF
jgi:RecB family endonuclease NucS